METLNRFKKITNNIIEGVYMIDMKKKIYKALEKKRESIVIDLYLNDYDGSNFYIALVYNRVIEKFKVLFVPVDAIRLGDKVEDYFCYQFIFMETVNYIMELIRNNKNVYVNEKDRNRAVPTNNSYYIEMTTHVAGEDYEFNFTQFFDDDYIFIFDVIVSLFEHCPHIVGELCSLILAQYNSSYELIKYTSSFNFDLMSDDYKLMFNDDVINNCKYTYDDIVCLERFNSKYYGVINNKRFIFEEVIGSDSLNIYSENSSPIGEEVFILMKAIRDGIIKKFNRLEVSLEKNFSKCLVLYSYDVSVYDKKFLVFNKLLDKEVTFSLMENKCLKVTFCSDEFKNKIIKYIEDKYEKDKAKELVDFIF